MINLFVAKNVFKSNLLDTFAYKKKSSLVTRFNKKNRGARVTVYGQEMKPGLNPVVKEAISHMTSSDGNVKSVKINKIVINK